MEGNQMSRNNLIVSLLCNNRGLDPAKFLGDVDDVKSLYINILTASGVGVSVKLNDEVSKWLSFAENFTVNDLSRLNEELVQKSVLFGNGVKPSEIDLIVFASVYSSVVGLSNSEREKLPHVMTWMYNIQLQLKAQESPAAVETQTNANPIAYANITANNYFPVCLLAPIESPASPLDLLPPIDSPVRFVAPKDSPVCLVVPKDSPVHLVTPKDSPVCLVAPKDSPGCLIAPVDSVIRIQGSKATTRKNEEKLKEYESGCTLREEKIALKPTTAKKLALMSEFISVKEKEIDMQLLYADTSKMSGAQREIHAKLLEKFKEKYL
ncbi:hypothetical protein ACFE04_016808 [Oxalis oulophora]